MRGLIMKEIKFWGRGGQGAVTAAGILAQAAFDENKFVQAFPMFGVERRGAPVQAFTRISDEKILIRSEIYEPDVVVVMDPTLMQAVNVTAGLKNGGILIVNSEQEPKSFAKGNYKVATVNATDIAIENGLGSKTAPIVNTAILGAVVRATGITKLELVMDAIKKNAPAKPEQNAKAAKDAYDKTKLGW